MASVPISKRKAASANLLISKKEASSDSDRYSCDDALIKLDSAKGVSKVLKYVNDKIPADIDSLRKLQEEEFKNNELYKMGWARAVEHYNLWVEDPTRIKVNQKKHPKEYHIALIGYSLKHFYGDFNTKTREIGSSHDFKNYQYKSFFKLLLLAVAKVVGSPETQSMYLYRGISVDVSNARVGNFVQFQQFTSTTSSLDKAKKYAKGKTLFVIQGVIPYSIGMDHHSWKQSNKEILITPFEYYMVTEITTLDGHDCIVLKA